MASNRVCVCGSQHDIASRRTYSLRLCNSSTYTGLCSSGCSSFVRTCRREVRHFAGYMRTNMLLVVCVPSVKVQQAITGNHKHSAGLSLFTAQHPDCSASKLHVRYVAQHGVSEIAGSRAARGDRPRPLNGAHLRAHAPRGRRARRAQRTRMRAGRARSATRKKGELDDEFTCDLHELTRPSSSKGARRRVL